MDLPNIALSSQNPEFRFANKSHWLLKYHLFSRCRQRGQQGPRSRLGYLHYDDIADLREKQFPACRRPENSLRHVSYSNPPGWRLHQIKVAQITPKNWAEDPYLVFVLFSVAQVQERHRKLPQPPIHTVCTQLTITCFCRLDL